MMTYRFVRHMLSGLVLGLSIASCEDVIHVDLRSTEPRLVIEGVVRLHSNAEVVVTKTKEFDGSNVYLPVTDAQVEIRDDAGNSERLRYHESGKYIADGMVGTARRTYRLSVVYDQVEYTSVSRMPPAVEIDSLTLWKLPVKDLPDPMVHFVDPEGEENQYYKYVISVNGVRPAGKERLRDRLISTEFVDGNIIRQPLFIGYESNKDEDPVQQGDVVTVEMQCLDKGTYRFFETLYRIDESLANPTSNIEGGALGYFGAYSFTTKDIVMQW